MTAAAQRALFCRAIGLLLMGAAGPALAQNPPETPGAQAFVPGPPPLRPEPVALDFGFLAPGEDRSGEVTLTNTSGRPVTILAIQPTCTCTTTSNLTGTVIPPGGTAKFDAKLGASVVPGPRKATVKILAEGFGQALELDVRGEVAMPLRAVPSAITPPPGGPGKGRFVIESVDRKPFRVLSCGGEPPVFLGFDPSKDQPKATYVLRYDLESLPRERWPAFWVVETDRADCPVLGLKVRDERFVQRTELKMREYALNLGVLEIGADKEIPVDLLEAIAGDTGVEAADGLIVRVARVDPLSDGSRVLLQVRPPGRAGAFVTTLKLRNGSREQVLRVYGVARAAAEAPAAPRG